LAISITKRVRKQYTDRLSSDLRRRSTGKPTSKRSARKLRIARSIDASWRSAPRRRSEEISHALPTAAHRPGITVIETDRTSSVRCPTVRARNDALHCLGKARQGASGCGQSAHTEFLRVTEGSRRAHGVQHSRGFGVVANSIRGDPWSNISHRAQPDGCDCRRACSQRRTVTASSAETRHSRQPSSSRDHAVRFLRGRRRPRRRRVTAFPRRWLSRRGPRGGGSRPPRIAKRFQRRLEARGLRRRAPGCHGRAVLRRRARCAVEVHARRRSRSRAVFAAELGALIGPAVGAGEVAQAAGRTARIVDVLWLSGQHSAAAPPSRSCATICRTTTSFNLLCGVLDGRVSTRRPAAIQPCARQPTWRSAPTDPGDGETSLTNELAQYCEQPRPARFAHRSGGRDRACANALRELRQQGGAAARERAAVPPTSSRNAAVGLHQIGTRRDHPVGPTAPELELLGYTREEYIGRRISDIHADRGREQRPSWPGSDAAEEVHDYEAQLARQGRLDPARADSARTSTPANGPVHQTRRCFMARQSPSAKQAEEALRAREAQPPDHDRRHAAAGCLHEPRSALRAG